MTQASVPGLVQKLDALFQAVVAEAEINPGFAAKLEAALDRGEASAAKVAFSASQSENAADGAPFDPLHIHLEAAIMNGLESEVRAFLAELTRAQLQEIVTVQRLPAAQTLLDAIDDAPDMAAALDAVMDRVVEKVRGRVSAAS